MVAFLVPTQGAFAAGPVRTYIGSNTSSANQTTYDFGNFNAPTAGLMIIGTGNFGDAAANRTVSSVSIGGGAATIHVNPSTGAQPSCIASRVVSSGNNNVTVTFSGQMQNGSVAVWLLTGYRSATPFDTDGINDSSSGTSRIATLDCPDRSIAFYYINHHNNNLTTFSAGTERVDQTLEDAVFAAADRLLTNGGIGIQETMSWTGSERSGFSAAVWR